MHDGHSVNMLLSEEDDIHACLLKLLQSDLVWQFGKDIDLLDAGLLLAVLLLNPFGSSDFWSGVERQYLNAQFIVCHCWVNHQDNWLGKHATVLLTLQLLAVVVEDQECVLVKLVSS